MSNAIITLVLLMALQGQMIHGGQIEDLQCRIGGYRGGGPRHDINLHTSNAEDAFQNQDECRFESHPPIDPHTFDLAPTEGITFPTSPSQSALKKAMYQRNHFVLIGNMLKALFSEQELGEQIKQRTINAQVLFTA